MDLIGSFCAHVSKICKHRIVFHLEVHVTCTLLEIFILVLVIYPKFQNGGQMYNLNTFTLATNYLVYYVDLLVASAVFLVLGVLTYCGCRQGAFLETTWRRVYSHLPHCYHYCTCSKAKYLRVVAAGRRKTCARTPRSKKTTDTQVLTF